MLIKSHNNYLMARRIATLIPSSEELLRGLGSRIRLARLRRGLAAKQVAADAGMVPMTLRSIERGGSGVTIGAYLAVMQVLGLEQDVDLLAQADRPGRSLQDRRLTRPGRSRTSSVISSTVTASRRLTADEARRSLARLPEGEIRTALAALPAEQFQEIREAAGQAIERLPARQLQEALQQLSGTHIQAILAAVWSEQLRSATDPGSITRAT